MSETARDIFELYVLLNVREFLARPSDRRLGTNAAVSVWHFVDKLWAYYSKFMPARCRGARAFEQFRDAILRECPDLAYVRDACDVNKHFRLSRSTRLITNSTDIWPVGEELEMQLDAGGTIRVSDKIRSAVDFFRLELAGVPSSNPTIP